MRKVIELNNMDQLTRNNRELSRLLIISTVTGITLLVFLDLVSKDTLAQRSSSDSQLLKIKFKLQAMWT